MAPSEHLLDQINHPAYLIDPRDSFRFAEVNDAACRHFGWPRSELLRMTIPDWDPIYSLDACVEIWDRIKREKTILFETTHKVKGGLLVNVEVTASYLYHADKEYIFGFIQNIEARKHAEDQLKQAIHFRDEIMSVLSHDLRNPIGAIAGFADLIRSESRLGPEALGYLSRIESACSRMTEMIETLLDFSRSRFGEGIPLERKSTSLADVCQEVVTEVGGAWGGREICVDVGQDSAGWWDRARLSQVVSNLMVNALTHGSPDRPIEIKAYSRGSFAVLQVHNYGPPIPDKLLPEIFKPFRHGPSQRKGLGLGLYIVDRIVAAHGGQVSVESTPDHGTTFTVCLPFDQTLGKSIRIDGAALEKSNTETT